MIKPSLNPILAPRVRVVNPDEFDAPHVTARRESLGRRSLERLFRRQSAADFIGRMEPGAHRFGLTKGQFSLIDLLKALSGQIGPAHLSLSTWTAARADLGELEALCNRDRFLSVRFLIDFSFQRRQPAMIAHIRRVWGNAAVVVTRNHAKFMLLGNDPWRLVIRTSMNLNFNPRLEDVEVKDDPQLYAFLDDILHDFFNRHVTENQSQKTVRELAAEFAAID